MMRYLTLYLCLFWANSLWAEADSTLSIALLLTFDNAPLVIGESDNDLATKGIEIEVFKLYLSNLELYEGEELVFAEPQSYHLIDAENPESLNLILQVPSDLSFSSLRFNVGIDSLTNVSGAFGGDLDPTNGMYWTWQSGYINFKLEGRAAQCPARHQRFQYHIGGYQPPFNALQKVVLKVPDLRKLQIKLSIDQFLAQINIEETYQLMSPNKQSLAFAQFIPSLFSVLSK